MNFFVYGTLKPDQSRGQIWEGYANTYIEDSLEGELFDLGPFPAMTEGEDSIEGYTVKTDGGNILEIIDSIEGHPELFQRREVTTEKGYKAWCYFMDGTQVSQMEGRKVEDGVWRG